MFFRGQPIKIESSSAKQRQHPNTGDKGFISAGAIVIQEGNYLALIEAYFYQYNGDASPCRCERKMFLVGKPTDKEIMKAARQGIAMSKLVGLYILTYDEVINWRNGISVGRYIDEAFNICKTKNKYTPIKLPVCTVGMGDHIPVQKSEYTRAAWFRAAHNYLLLAIKLRSQTSLSKARNGSQLPIWLDSISRDYASYSLRREHLPPFKCVDEGGSQYQILQLIGNINRLQSFIIRFIKKSNNYDLVLFKSLLGFHLSVGTSFAALNRFDELFVDHQKQYEF